MLDVNASCAGCFICGDPDDHNGQPHSEATGDGRTRYDVDGPAVPMPLEPQPAPGELLGSALLDQAELEIRAKGEVAPAPGREQIGDVIEGGFTVTRPSPPPGSVTVGVPGRGFVLVEPSGMMTAYNADGSMAGELTRISAGRLELRRFALGRPDVLPPVEHPCPLAHTDEPCTVCGATNASG